MADEAIGTKPRGRRRRGYGGRNPRGGGGTSILHAPGFERWMAVAVGAMALVYVVLMGQWFHSNTVMLGYRPTGGPKSEILYGFGRPQAVSLNGAAGVKVDAATPIENYDRWQYPSETGGTFVVHFDGDGVSDEVSCVHPTGDRGACPAAFGIELGDSESQVAWRLGGAPVRVLNGPDAVLHYPSIGVDFQMRQYRVRGITVRRQTSPILARLPRFVRFLIP
ncbi:MAG: hypothetical protein V4574_17055 [Pseudomonadota bacterium]